MIFHMKYCMVHVNFILMSTVLLLKFDVATIQGWPLLEIGIMLRHLACNYYIYNTSIE